MDVAMKSKTPQLNKTTKSLKSLFPSLSALIAFTPLIVSAEIIVKDSTDTAQIFSSDNTYIIPEGISITNNTATPTVTISGNLIDGVINGGNVIGVGDGMYVTTANQDFELANQQNALIESTAANGITVNSMNGEINNAGKIIGAEKGIQVLVDSDSFGINNTSTGTIEGKTAIFADAGIAITNAGILKGSTGNGIELNTAGKSTLTNNGTIEGAEHGILVTGEHRFKIGNAGLIKGSESAITFQSNQSNMLTLDTGSELDGDVISTNSKTNTLILIGQGSEDSNFRGLNEDDGFA